LAGSLSSKRGF